MVIFGPRPRANLFGKMSIYSNFCASCFYSVERRFFVLENRKRHFPGLNCLKKKKMEKWPLFDQNHGLNPLENINVKYSTFQTSCFLSVEKLFSF